MEWIRLFEVASKDLDADAPLLRGILDDLGQIARCPEGGGYRLDPEAQLAMGWWFFAVYVREEFVRGAVGHLHAKDPRARDERALLDYIRGRLGAQKSTATVKLHGKQSIFGRYWTWLMR